MGTCSLPLPRVFFYVPNESALIRICFNRFTESARTSSLARSASLSLPRVSFHERRTELFATAPRSTRSIRITGGDSPRSAAASVIGVSKGSIQTRRDETRAREKDIERRSLVAALDTTAGRVIRQRARSCGYAPRN